MTEDQYLTLPGKSEGLYREKGSKFIAYAFPVSTEEDIKASLEEVRKEHPKSRHVCYAYRLGTDGNTYRANDDGEPSGSAGRPILGQIDSKGLTDTLVAVVRYFGGTKLGIPGLIHAYKTCTAEALEEQEFLVKTIENHYTISFDYGKMSSIMGAVKKAGIRIVSQDFGVEALLNIAIPKSEAEKSLLAFKSHVLNISLDHALTIEKMEGIEVEFIKTR